MFDKIKCLFKHDYSYVGSYYQECKPRRLNSLYGLEVFRLYRCNRCKKYYKEKIVRHSTVCTYDYIINNLKKNGYKHINTYYQE